MPEPEARSGPAAAAAHEETGERPASPEPGGGAKSCPSPLRWPAPWPEQQLQGMSNDLLAQEITGCWGELELIWDATERRIFQQYAAQLEMERRRRLAGGAVLQTPVSAAAAPVPSRGSGNVSRLAAVKRDVIAAGAVPELIERMGIGLLGELRGNRRRCRCPYPGHEDLRPSAVVYLDQARLHCFGCGRGGDVFDLLVMTGHARTLMDAARLATAVIARMTDLDADEPA